VFILFTETEFSRYTIITKGSQVTLTAELHKNFTEPYRQARNNTLMQRDNT